MKKIIIIIGSIFGFLGICFLYWWFFAQGAITITASPQASKIFVDNHEVGANKVKIKEKRGIYKIKVVRREYTTETQEIEIYGFQKKSFSFSLKRLPEAWKIKENIATMDLSKTYERLLLGDNGGREFIKYDPIGKKEELLSRVDFGQAKRVKWSPNNYLTYIWRSDGSSGLVDLKRYDLLNQIFTAGKKGVTDLAWNSDGGNVVLIYKPGDGEFSLVRSTPLGENMERLYLHLDREGMIDPKVYWTKNSNDVVLQDKDIFDYNIYSHKLTKVTQSGKVKWAKLSQSGKYILYADKVGTYVIDLTGKQVRKWADSLDAGEWLSSGNKIIGVSNGEFMILNGEDETVIEYGYNGKRIKDITTIGMVKNNNEVYFLRKNGEIWNLKLQTKVKDRT